MIGDVTPLLSAFAMGLVLGAIYLASLWRVVQHLPRTRHVGFWLLGTAVLRIGLLLAALYWVAEGQWETLLAGVLGLAVTRLAATRWAAASGARRPVSSRTTLS